MLSNKSRDLALAFIQNTNDSANTKKRARDDQTNAAAGLNDTDKFKKTKTDFDASASVTTNNTNTSNNNNRFNHLSPLEQFFSKQEEEKEPSQYQRGAGYNNNNNNSRFNNNYNNNNNNRYDNYNQYGNNNNYNNYNQDSYYGNNNNEEEYYAGQNNYNYDQQYDNNNYHGEEAPASFMGDETTTSTPELTTTTEDMMDKKQDNVWIMSAKKLPLDQTSLDEKIIHVMREKLKFEELFAVQRAVVPVAIAMTQSQTPCDICVSSPTGSGKTLSYVLPILQCCMKLRFTKLRAMVVVPSKTLAQQVYSVFKQFAREVGLVVELCDGSLPSFEREQKRLVGRAFSHNKNNNKNSNNKKNSRDSSEGEFCSLAHIIIGTPNRLLRHVRDTKGFLEIMSCLKFIVLDEVDTMLDGSVRGNSVKQLLEKYESHMRQLGSHLSETDVPVPVPYVMARKILCSATLTPHAGRLAKLNLHRPQFFTNMLKHTPLAPMQRPDAPQVDSAAEKEAEKEEATTTTTEAADVSTVEGGAVSSSVKIMEDDESSKDQKYSVPDTLRQYVSTYESYYKPLYLVALLLHPNLQLFAKQRKILCFCDTPENASRLNTILKAFLKTGAWKACMEINESMVAEKRRVQNQKEIDVYQGMATPGEGYRISEVFDTKMRGKVRAKVLKDFQNSAFSILICTDVLGRGVDLEVDTVINYDTPGYLKGYMHRVGRTARAGKLGAAITLVEQNEKEPFKQKLTKRVSMREPVTDYLVSTKVVEQMKDLYKDVLSEYKNLVKNH